MVEVLGRYSNRKLPLPVGKPATVDTAGGAPQATRRGTPSGIQTARPRGWRLSQADIAAICEAYAEGRSTYELAADWGIWRGTVSATLKRKGVRLRQQTKTF
jgi:hypothetical protein